MASVAAPSPGPQRSQFERIMDNTNLRKEDINNMVMDFLVQEGYPEAASHFAHEANLNQTPHQSYIQERVQIRTAIYRGDLQTAIESVNAIDPELLDLDKPLHFSLLRLQLIELIKSSFHSPESETRRLVTEACAFARDNLAPYTGQAESFKTDLERALSLLIIPRPAWHESDTSHFGQLSELVNPSLKVEVAKNVNAAILQRQGLEESSWIHRVLQARAWSETLAKSKGLELDEKCLRTALQAETGPAREGNGHSSSPGGDTHMTEDDGAADVVGQYTNIP